VFLAGATKKEDGVVNLVSCTILAILQTSNNNHLVFPVSKLQLLRKIETMATGKQSESPGDFHSLLFTLSRLLNVQCPKPSNDQTMRPMQKEDRCLRRRCEVRETPLITF
jgi:hypothetical protein